MIKNQNIPATIMVFLNQLKTFIKNRQPSKLPLHNFLAKFLTEKKCQMNSFTIAMQTFF